MTAALNVLKGQLKLDPKLSSILSKGNKMTTKARRRRTRRICSINVSRKRMRLGRKSRQRMVKNMKKKPASILTVGVSTTWRGLSTSLLTAS
jgi:hypothetical protein